jgi:type III pantothenate kinase
MLAIDVGNTETVLGLFDGEQLLGTWRITTRTERTADELALVIRSLLRRHEPATIGPVAIASVVPPFTPILVQAIAQMECAATVIDGTTPLPIRLDVDEPMTVGADRIVNTLAASRLYGRDTIAVDLGTATSFDCITSDGTFIGGVIAPGVLTGAETLVSRTAKLPRVELKAPPTVIGRRTEAVLRSGIFYNAVDGIDGIVRRIKQEWQRADALVVATGGLAPLIAPHCTTVQHIEPALTLHGLRFALEYVRKT